MPKEMIEIRDGELTLNIHPGQERAWDSEKRFVFILAGTQGGKTSFGPWWLYREIQKCGPGDYLAVTANYDLFKLKMLPEMRKVFEETLHVGRYWAAERIIEIKNPHIDAFEAEKASDGMWARIILRSAVAGTKRTREGAGGLESSTAKAAWLDESGLDEFPLQAWEAILRRVALSEGRILGTTTLYNINWMKHEIFDQWQAGDPDYEVIQFDSIENPIFPQSQYARAQRTMPSWKFNMIYRGRYDRPAGMIFSDYDNKVHLVEPFTIPKDWPRFVGIDPGPIHTATCWIAEDVNKNSFYVYRATLEGNLSSKQHAKKALALATDERVVSWCGGSQSELQFRIDWKDAGVPVAKPPFWDVEAGIDHIIQLLREKKIFFLSDCEIYTDNPSDFKDIFDELNQYSHPLDANGKPTRGIRNKEKYHRLDALRYGVSSLSQKKAETFYHSVMGGK